jgi:hypothetical protein
MPDEQTVEAAKEDLREGKKPSTAAGEFVRQEMDHIREGKHGARSTKQAIAIGLSEARRAGIPLPAPKKGSASKRTVRAAKSALRAGRKGAKKPSRTRSRATRAALSREPRKAASHRALSMQARRSAAKRKRARRK